jgi:hypothetical protein
MTRTGLRKHQMPNNKHQSNDKHQITRQKDQEATFERCALKFGA